VWYFLFVCIPRVHHVAYYVHCVLKYMYISSALDYTELFLYTPYVVKGSSYDTHKLLMLYILVVQDFYLLLLRQWWSNVIGRSVILSFCEHDAHDRDNDVDQTW